MSVTQTTGPSQKGSRASRLIFLNALLNRGPAQCLTRMCCAACSSVTATASAGVSGSGPCYYFVTAGTKLSLINRSTSLTYMPVSEETLEEFQVKNLLPVERFLDLLGGRVGHSSHLKDEICIALKSSGDPMTHITIPQYAVREL